MEDDQPDLAKGIRKQMEVGKAVADGITIAIHLAGPPKPIGVKKGKEPIRVKKVKSDEG